MSCRSLVGRKAVFGQGEIAQRRAKNGLFGWELESFEESGRDCLPAAGGPSLCAIPSIKPKMIAETRMKTVEPAFGGRGRKMAEPGG